MMLISKSLGLAISNPLRHEECWPHRLGLDLGLKHLLYLIFIRYEASCGSLAWYSPMTCLVTSKESLFTNKLRTPNFLASNIPAIKASYSAWLLLALSTNLRACSIKSPLGPSTMTPAPLFCWLEDPSIERTHSKSFGSGWAYTCL